MQNTTRIIRKNCFVMKANSSSSTLIATLVLALALMSTLTAIAAESSTATQSIGNAAQQSPSSADLMRTAYLALVRDSIVPANPRVVANAALEAIASLSPDHVRPLPATFGSDVERDAAWLAERVTNLSPVWPVFDAMVHANATPHVGFPTPERRKGIRALSTGEPLATHGFNFYALPDGRFVIFDVIKGASADTSGLRLGDIILSIDGVRASRIDTFLLSILPAGAEKTLVVERADHSETIKLRLTKTEISPIESRLLDDGIGYVFVRWFAQSENAEHDTATLARRAFTSLAAQGARGLILDLRSCLGGIGNIGMASALCDGEILYFAQQPLSAPAQPVKRDGERCWPDRPIVLLVNQQTISAPEALALTLRELAHTKIIGQKTAGALTEMSFTPLAEGYAMTIPTGVVLGPISGKDQPDHAIQPDIKVPNPSLDDLLHCRDPQLDAARAALTNSHGKQ